MNGMKTAMLLAAMTALFMALGLTLGGRGGMMIALMIAVAHVLNKMGNDSELIVMNAAGMAPWQVFRRITLPQVMPLLLIAILFRTIEAFKQFDLVMGLTGGGPGDATETVSIRLYKLAFQGQYDTGMSSALAYVILVIIIAVSNLYIRQLNKARG